jgi:hypothetical protein
MPFSSEAQRAFMYANKPGLAQEFQSKTPKGKKLPYKAAKKKTKSDHQMEAMKKKLKK